jgi:hypothetical protein
LEDLDLDIGMTLQQILMKCNGKVRMGFPFRGVISGEVQ